MTIKFAFHDDLEISTQLRCFICIMEGYDPQKLLPDGRSAWDKLLHAYMSAEFGYFSPARFAADRVFPTAAYDKEMIEFPLTGEGRRLAPFVSPRIKHRTVVVVADNTDLAATVAALNDNPFVSAINLDIDFAKAELHALAIQGVLGVYIEGKPVTDYDGAIFHSSQGFGKTYARGYADLNAFTTIYEDENNVVSTSAGKRDMSYLKHDPSKKHRRKRK